LTTGDDHIFLQVQNSVPDNHYTKDQAGGIGLQNVRRQLELVYPDLHELQIEAGPEVFSVELRIFV
ncbi:MAG: histidine kinase, partial [Thermoanaerobaculia bacterium]|nr:histidine kinase [Thermoanaerobaculia bacterium]